MNSKVEQAKAASAGDIVKYALALALVVAGLFAFYWFGDWPTAAA
jgi:preprotein translocase subunit SecE